MSTVGNEETSWLEDQVRHSTAGLSWDRLTEQTRTILTEVGAHRSKNAQHHARARKNEKCHQARRYWQSLDRHNSQTTTCQSTGTRETTTSVDQPEMWIIVHTSSDRAQQIDDSTETERT